MLRRFYGVKTSRPHNDLNRASSTVLVDTRISQGLPLDRAADIDDLQLHLFFVEVFCPFLANFQDMPRKVASTVSRRQCDLEVPRNRNQRALNQIIVDIVCVGWIRLASLDSVQAEQTEKPCVNEFASNGSSWT